MSRTGARLLLGLIAFVLVGWGVGELLLSVLASADLNAVRDAAAERPGIVTQAARAVTKTLYYHRLDPVCVIQPLSTGSCWRSEPTSAKRSPCLATRASTS